MAYLNVSARSVLDYLRDMVDLCRGLHRSDLERDYRDAWARVALAIYGQLPTQRWKPSIQYAPPEPRKKTVGQIESLLSPSRKVIGRDDMEDILECGHRVWNVTYENGPAKRRRCKACFRESQKKDVSSVALSTSRREVS